MAPQRGAGGRMGDGSRRGQNCMAAAPSGAGGKPVVVVAWERGGYLCPGRIECTELQICLHHYFGTKYSQLKQCGRVREILSVAHHDGKAKKKEPAEIKLKCITLYYVKALYKSVYLCTNSGKRY